ncbi:MAG: chemotaxis protein CheB [Candidatus Kapaibacterium sp.]
MNKYNAIVMGLSAGGMEVLTQLFVNLNNQFPLPIIIAQHLHPKSENNLPVILNNYTGLNVKEAVCCDPIKPGFIYTAPPDYHVLIERDYTISLSSEEKVNFSRPSIDVLFESAASVWTDKLIGIIMTGANNDGALGIKTIKENNGLTIAENTETAQYPDMPGFAIDTGCIDLIYSKDEIRVFLENLYKN